MCKKQTKKVLDKFALLYFILPRLSADRQTHKMWVLT